MKKLLIFSSLVLLFSCVPHRKLRYLQTDHKSPETYNLEVPVENIIAPGHYLSIKVESVDERNFFATDDGGAATAMNEIMLTRNAFLVDSLGEVNLPEIGKVNVSGLSLSECSEKLHVIVKSYFGNPTVDVRFAFKTFTILGEVNEPGRYFFASNGYNIFEALGEASDLTFYGKRKDVHIIREVNGQTRKIKVDLTDDNIMLSDYYFIKDNDIILINSRNRIRWEEITPAIGTIVSSISLVILVLTLTETY